MHYEIYLLYFSDLFATTATSPSVKGVETICGFVTDGGFFGDFEHTSNSLAIASYTAASSCDLLGVSYENFDAAMKKHLTEKIKVREIIAMLSLLYNLYRFYLFLPYRNISFACV